ncbi:hypothetical protein EWM64_g9105 [Hericium alpestre]|uniref:galacturonan 1,4-alpha-galacturonidase n=1 Tax=Hericium alpestre TaxID=135208 RepID=A0A4Y9ZN16_9AGAM|nr:hypothetical protein EWM64_g9105 [Hericium alpestre]
MRYYYCSKTYDAQHKFEFEHDRPSEQTHQFGSLFVCASDSGAFRQNAFFFDFQNASTFWILGGTGIVLDGGGTLDGTGQAWWDALPSNSTLQRPIILTVFEGTDVTVRHINEVNSPFWFNLVSAAVVIVHIRHVILCPAGVR